MGEELIGKQAIIAGYLVGETTYRKLEARYGFDFRLIHSWVMKYRNIGLRSYSNTVRNFIPILSNQLRVSDITYLYLPDSLIMK